MYRTHGGDLWALGILPVQPMLPYAPKDQQQYGEKPRQQRPDMPDQAVFPWLIWSGWERKRNRRTAEPLGKRSVLEAEPIGIVIKMSSESESEATQGDLGQLGIFGPVRRQAADFVEKPVPAAPSRPPA